MANANLTFSSGLVWMEDAHYNGSKMPGTSQQVHTFIWDNVGFDGPRTYRDFAYDVPIRERQRENTGWALGPGQTLEPRRDGRRTGASRPPARTSTSSGTRTTRPCPRVSVNGGPYHATAWPFDAKTYTERTISVPIPLSEIHNGTNSISFQSDFGVVVHDVSLVLVNAAPVP